MKKIKKEKNISPIHFRAMLSKIGSLTIIKLPNRASVLLPSRGMVMVKGTINGFHFQSALEPDGKKGHWFKVDKTISKSTGIKVGDSITFAIEPIKEWPEPIVPEDLKEALSTSPRIHKLWVDITPNARWDWIRWINATKNPKTREIRIEKTFSKLRSGKRTACCFNRSMCTEADVSNNGILLGQ